MGGHGEAAGEWIRGYSITPSLKRPRSENGGGGVSRA